MAKIKNIIFDFDGVILDSVPVKTEAFRQLFKDFPSNIVDQFITYHEENGGISRYIKIEYFFKTLLKENITETEVIKYANKYSLLTKQELANPKYLIGESFDFIKEHYRNINMHVASGADEADLHYICDTLELNQFFISIHGSPTPKNDVVKNILLIHKYILKETILIGDSINDFTAADKNNITFYGYNNTSLEEDHHYIKSFNTIDFI